MKQSNNSVLEPILEAILNAAEEPLSITKLINLFPEDGQPERETILTAITSLQKSYEGRGVELAKVAQGYRIQTRSQFSPWIERLYQTKPPKLSRALMETLSIIAYRQPVTRGDIQEIRGVSVSSDIMQRLLEREWVKRVGERETPGRPSIYATTNEFLSYFNLESLKDLPELKEPRQLDEIAKEMNMSLEAVAPMATAAEQNKLDDEANRAPLDSAVDESTQTDTGEEE
ncbi:MAG: segregation and condensation protein B [Saprospiraceae bacterium]|jgi:segregation and condensation protein B